MTKNKIRNLIQIFKKLGVLKEVKRTGWILKGIKEPESIADHNLRVSAMATILCDKYTNLDKTRVIELSLIHDWGVIKLGDIISEHGKKVVGDKKSKHLDERNVVIELVKPLNKSSRYIKLWDEYNEQKTKEAKFLKQVEKLEMTIQALEYEEKGYPPNSLNEFWENAEKYLEGQSLEPIFRQLQKMRKTP